MPTFEASKAALLVLQADLNAQISLGADAAKPVSLDTEIGRLTRMDALQSQAVAQDGQARRKQRLLRVQSALQRLERGTYGDCVRCHEAIADARLEAEPEVLLCLDCAKSPRRG